MMRVFRILVAIALLSAVSTEAQRSDTRTSVFVSAPLREGFIDADASVLDSVNDVQKALRSSRTLQLVVKRDTADVVVTILGRTIGPSGGAIGVPIGSTAVLLPINSRSIQWALRVGDFESTRVSEDHDHDSWRAVADALVKDLAAWVRVNHDAVHKRDPRP